MYQFAHTALERNLSGMTDDDAVTPMQPAGNCANWLVGHLLWTRDMVHGLLGLPGAWPSELGPNDLYRRGATEFLPDRAVSLTRLREAMSRSQEILMPAISKVSASKLEERVTDTSTVGERLAFLGFHEGYHVGQIGLVRRLLGKPGAIP
jgi:uncharacterized damage-inducible protein DinB